MGALPLPSRGTLVVGNDGMSDFLSVRLAWQSALVQVWQIFLCRNLCRKDCSTPMLQCIFRAHVNARRRRWREEPLVSAFDEYQGSGEHPCAYGREAARSTEAACCARVCLKRGGQSSGTSRGCSEGTLLLTLLLKTRTCINLHTRESMPTCGFVM